MCDIRTLTYNVFCRPPGIVNTNHFTDYKWERLKDIERGVLPHFDIVCLQELFNFGSRRREWFVDAARRQGFRTVVCSQSRENELVHTHYRDYSDSSSSSCCCYTPAWRFPPSVIDGGLVILSRYPQVTNTTKKEMVFSTASGPDALAEKGALMVRLALPTGVHIDVYVSHMQAEDGPEKTAIRYEQLKELTTFIRTCSGDAQNDIVVFADMNIDSNDETIYQRLCTEMQVMYEFPMMCSSGTERQMYAEDVLECRAPRCQRPLITYGDNGEDTVLTHPSDARRQERIDYIWMLKRVLGTERIYPGSYQRASIDQQLRPSIECTDARIQKFQCVPRPDEGRPYGQWSDHYGVSATFRVHHHHQ